MTLQIAVVYFVRQRSAEDIADVALILCALATMAHALGNYRSRDDSIEAAAGLLASVHPRAPRQ